MEEISVCSNFHPLVSIIIPVYNGEAFLAKAIESALNQTYDNIEVIVVNDGSSDNTWKILDYYSSRIKVFSKENGGVSSALNLGLEQMEGDYFSWLSHDDVYLEDKVEKQVRFLIDNPDKQDSILFSDFYFTDENCNILSKSDLSFSRNLNFRLWITVFSQLHGCSLLIPSTSFSNLRFNKELKYTQDYDMWFRISKTYQFIYLPIPLLLARQHENQDSKKLSGCHLKEVKRIKSHFINGLTTEELKIKRRHLLYLIKNIYSNDSLILGKIHLVLLILLTNLHNFFRNNKK